MWTLLQSQQVGQQGVKVECVRVTSNVTEQLTSVISVQLSETRGAEIKLPQVCVYFTCLVSAHFYRKAWKRLGYRKAPASEGLGKGWGLGKVF